MTKVAEELIYQGRILDLARETHRMPNDNESNFEIVRHPGGAAALPIMANGDLLLIRQFRPAARDYIYEIPAGRLEVGGDGAECIERELQEEGGYRPGKIESLGYVYSSVGFCTEKIHLYLASGLTKTATALEPDEFIEPFIVTLDGALAMIKIGTINDAKTQIAVLRYALERGDNR